MIQISPSGRAVVFAVVLALIAPNLAVAQAGVFRGTVIDDASEAPVAGARVQATRSGARPQATLADSAGYFQLSLPPGAYNVTAGHQGYASSRPIELTVSDGDTVQIEIRLSVQAVLLAPIEVISRPRPLHINPGIAGFHQRRTEGLGGWFLTSEEIASRPTTDAAQLLYGSGFSVVGGSRAGPRALVGTRTNCPPEIYLDGKRITSYERVAAGLPEMKHRIAMEALDMISTAVLEGIEVYRGAATLPPQFGGSTGQCGVIAFWTRRGL